MKHIKSCGCIILKNHQVLLIESKDRQGNPYWSFPKGHQEPGETDRETALRETKEEVGLDVEIIDPTPVKTGRPLHDTIGHKDIYLFLAKPISNRLKIQPEEIVSAQWVPLPEAEKLLQKMGYYLEAWHAAQPKIATLLPPPTHPTYRQNNQSMLQ